MAWHYFTNARLLGLPKPFSLHVVTSISSLICFELNNLESIENWGGCDHPNWLNSDTDLNWPFFREDSIMLLSRCGQPMMTTAKMKLNELHWCRRPSYFWGPQWLDRHTPTQMRLKPGVSVAKKKHDCWVPAHFCYSLKPQKAPSFLDRKNIPVFWLLLFEVFCGSMLNGLVPPNLLRWRYTWWFFTAKKDASNLIHSQVISLIFPMKLGAFPSTAWQVVQKLREELKGVECSSRRIFRVINHRCRGG